MPNQNNTAWTDELIQEIKSLWDTKSVTQIATILNQRGHTFTRAAVSGKLKRLGLNLSDKTILHPSTAGVAGDDERKPRSQSSRPPRQEISPVEPKHLTVFELTDSVCKFECSGAEDPREFTFCGNPVAEGKPYCHAHCAICYLPRQPSKPNNVVLFGRHRNGIARAA